MKIKSFVFGLLIGILAMLSVQMMLPYESFAFLNRKADLTVFLQEESKKDSKSNRILELLNNYYVGEMNIENMKEGMYTGMVYGVGDKYTSYMDRENYQMFLEDAEGIFVGIGVLFRIDEEDNLMTIIQTFDNAPSAKVGLRAGDKIISVNGVEVSGDNYDEAVKMIKGRERSKVKLEILREGEKEAFPVIVTRERIEVPTVHFDMLENKMAYIQITQFSENTYEQFKEAYENALKQNAIALILDLRNNPGGMLSTVVRITDMLVPEGTIVCMEDKHGKRKYEYSDKEEIHIPLALLVNNRSASASEVLAGAVKDYKKGVLVGDKTFGKGVVQRIYPLQDKTALKITIQKYYTPSGVCIHDIGIDPDYNVLLSKENDRKLFINALEKKEDEQLQKAMEVLLQIKQ